MLNFFNHGLVLDVVRAPSWGAGFKMWSYQAFVYLYQYCVVSVGTLKMREWNMQEWKMRHNMAKVEISGVEFAALNGHGKLESRYNI